MATSADDPFLYRRVLSQAMSDLLADPFSELTRKRQTSLLLAATAALLLSAGILTVNEIDIAGAFKFALGTAQAAKWLAFAVTAYLLIAYLLGVWADWAIGKAKRWSPLASVEDMKATMDSDAKTRTQVNIERKERIKRFVEQSRKIQAEWERQNAATTARREKIEAERSSLPEFVSASPEQRERRRTLDKEDEELDRSDSFLGQHFSDRLESLQRDEVDLVHLMVHDTLGPGASMWNEHMDIEKTLSTFKSLTLLRLLLEIVFPAAYAVFALGWVLLYMRFDMRDLYLRLGL